MIKNTYQWLSMVLLNNKKPSGFFEPLLQTIFSFYNANKFRAKIICIRNENTKVYTLVLKVSRRWKGFKAGQFVELVVEQKGTKVTRIFSISSAVNLYKSKRIIELSIQKQANGRMTEWMHHSLDVGQFVNISAAKGHFTLNNDSQPILLIAAGTGITPFRSMLSEVSSKAHIHLLYYAKNSKHLFVKELKNLEKSSKNIKITFINSSEKGRICQQHLEHYCPDFIERVCYICGPSEMIGKTKQLLITNNVPSQKVNYEYFGSRPINDINIDTSGIVSFIKSSLAINGSNKNKQTLLELAESVDLKPTTGCRMGICHQCICEKQQGVVYNTLTKSFSDTGKEEVQLCISVPVGDVNINL